MLQLFKVKKARSKSLRETQRILQTVCTEKKWGYIQILMTISERFIMTDSGRFSFYVPSCIFLILCNEYVLLINQENNLIYI